MQTTSLPPRPAAVRRVDVSPIAQECGLSHRVALTVGVCSRCVSVPEGVAPVQSARGRAADILAMLDSALQRVVLLPGGAVPFQVQLASEDGPELVELVAVRSRRDTGLTVYLPFELAAPAASHGTITAPADTDEDSPDVP